jgi:epoxyqueuosine reductase
MHLNADTVRQRAVDLGFDLIGIVHAAPSPRLDAYVRWIDAGMHGTMGYMARADRLARRRDLNVILAGVQSLIVVGVHYGAAIPEAILRDPTRGRIAAYAWGVDYHDWIAPRLHGLAGHVAGDAHKVYVDTGAILERSHAQEAGLGFIGKNTMLIHPRAGSQFLLGVLLTTATFDRYDTPLPRETLCGTCTRCLAACPTSAFPAPHVLDARRCISYLTIEYKGAIDADLRPSMGNWIFGCDVCQDVCPFQRFAPHTRIDAFRPSDADRAAPPLRDLLVLDEANFRARFAGTPLERTGRERLVRNACIAAGNSGDPTLAAAVDALTNDPSALIRDHAAWAAQQLRFSDLKASKQ